MFQIPRVAREFSETDEMLLQVEKLVYVKAMRTGERNMFAKVSYSLPVRVDGQQIHCECHKEELVLLPTVDPFDITVKLASMQAREQKEPSFGVELENADTWFGIFWLQHAARRPD